MKYVLDPETLQMSK